MGEVTKRGAHRCYRDREWIRVSLPPEAARGLEVAAQRTRSIVHDLSGQPIEEMLVAAYLQGVMDGAQVSVVRKTHVDEAPASR